MLSQTFEWVDLFRLFFLSFLEIVLSLDNALILGLLAHHLPPQLRSKALYIGSLSAFFFRALALLSLAYLLQYRFLQVLGGAYLLYLAFHHFFFKSSSSFVPQPRSFWMTVLLIELFDLVFALDSILAGLAFISSKTSAPASKLWIVYCGGMIGLLAIRHLAHLFSSLIHRFPRLPFSAYAMIALIGVKLCLEAFFPLPPPLLFLFWFLLALLFLWGLLPKKPLAR